MFCFDGAYYIDSTTEQIYNEIVFPIVEVSRRGHSGHRMITPPPPPDPTAARPRIEISVTRWWLL